MSFVTIPAVAQLIYPYDLRCKEPGTTSYLLDPGLGNLGALAMGGQVWFKERSGTKTLNRIGLYLQGAVTTSPNVANSIGRVSLQGMSTSAFGPDGTILDEAYFFGVEYASGWTYTTAHFEEALEYGQKIVVVVDYDGNGVLFAGDRFSVFGHDMGSRSHGMPWIAKRFSGQSQWQADGGMPNIVFEFSDGTFGTLDGAFPSTGLSTWVLTSGNEIGMQFRLPAAAKIDALCALVVPQGESETETVSLLLYEGTTLLAQVEIDEAEHAVSAVHRLLVAPLDEEVELDAGTDYIVACRANNNAQAQVSRLVLFEGGHRSCFGDLNIGLVSRSTSGDPWSALDTVSIPRLGVRISAAELSPSFVAFSGSYAVTGSPATLRRGFRLAANSGAYTVTGSDADLRAPTHRLIADGGSYTYTGAAATLKYGRRLEATRGIHLHVGWAATLRVARMLTAASGSYAVTGSATTLRPGRGLSAASGSYAVAGFPATMRHGIRMAADSGEYAVTGFDTTLSTTQRIIEVDGGSYSYTGFPVTFTFNRRLAAESGSYTVTGSAAGLLADRAMQAESGNYTYLGTAAELTEEGFVDCRRSSAVYLSSPWRSMIPYPDGTIGVTDRRKVAYYYCADFGYSISTDVGSYTVTGFAATLRRTYKAQAESGSYSHTGFLANLQAARRVSAASGSYAVTGSNASLRYGRRLDAESGVYAVTGAATGPAAARLLSAASGEYTWTGSAAGLNIARKLIAASGSYDVTGFDTELIQFEPGWTKQFNYLVDDIFEP